MGFWTTVLVIAITFVIGFAIGALVYRNNRKQLNK